MNTTARPPFEQTYPLSPPSTPLLLACDTVPPPAPYPPSQLQHLKLSYAGTTRLVALPPADFTYPAITATGARLFALPPESTVAALRYLDADGDIVTLCTDVELEALLALVGGRDAAVKVELVVVTGPHSPLATLATGDAALSPVEADAVNLLAAVDDDEAIEEPRLGRTVSRSRGIGQRHASPASLAGRAGAPREESLGRRFMRRLSRQSIRSETGAECPPPPTPPLPSALPLTTSLSPTSTHGTFGEATLAPVRPALHARASTSRLLALRSAAPTPASPPVPPRVPPLHRRKSLAALADLFAPNRHISPVSRVPSAPSGSSSGLSGTVGADVQRTDAAPPSYYTVVRMNEAQRARRLGRGLVGACE